MTFASSRTFGIELEVILPPQYRDHSGYMTLARHIRAEAHVPCSYEAYGHEAPRGWKVVTDQSVPNGCEIVSPILAGADGVAQARRVAEALTSFGCTVNTSTGFHVHVGFDREDVAHVRKLAANFIRYEIGFDGIMPKSRRASVNQYIKSNRKAASGDYTAEGAERAFTKIMAATTLSDVRSIACHGNFHHCRYHKLNLISLDRQPTVEFRQHSGTTDPEKVANWIMLMVGFVDASATSRQRAWTGGEKRDELGELLRFCKASPEVAAFYRARRKEFKTREGEAG